MGNVWDEMRHAIADATNTLRAADSVAEDMAYLLKGRMRQVDNKYTLRALKRELRDFDSTTGTWKESK